MALVNVALSCVAIPCVKPTCLIFQGYHQPPWTARISLSWYPGETHMVIHMVIYIVIHMVIHHMEIHMVSHMVLHMVIHMVSSFEMVFWLLVGNTLVQSCILSLM